jgi:hypothetical protein
MSRNAICISVILVATTAMVVASLTFSSKINGQESRPADPALPRARSSRIGAEPYCNG